MFALLLASALATAQPTTYPEGFSAECRSSHEVWMSYAKGYPPPRPVEAARYNGFIGLRYTDGHFVVTQSAYDFIQQIADGGNGWKLEVLRQTPGDLVLLARSSGQTVLHLYVYHLQFDGKAGAMMVSSVSYGHPPASSSLTSYRCSIGPQGGQ